MKKIYILLFLTLFCVELFGQSLTNLNMGGTQSPQSLSNGEIGKINNSVDMYTGRINYNVSLKDITIAGINIPVGLGYTTNGFTVQEVAGNTGLGWNLSPNCVITRIVRGLPDDYYYGYCGSTRIGERCYSALVDWDFFEKTTAGIYDSEPDLFYFSFLGYSGSFVLDVDGRPVLQSNSSGIQILSNPFRRGTYTSSWKLRDQHGNEFLFDASEFVTNLHHGEKSNSYEFYKSAWYLTKVTTFNQQVVDFAYRSGANVTYTNYVNVQRNILPDPSPACDGNGNASWNENTDVESQPVYLSKISGENITINFEYNQTRDDLSGALALSSLNVNYKNRRLNTFNFNYGYFTSDDGTNTKRLKLNSVSEKFIGNVEKNLYSFYYNEYTNLPARNSLKTDYWGYYNNNSGNNNLTSSPNNSSNQTADKNPYFINTKANILEKVRTNLGGTINFEYEPNIYCDYSTNVQSGGLRLLKIYAKENENSSNIVNEVNYDYSAPNSTLSSGQSYFGRNVTLATSVSVICPFSAARREDYYSSEQPQGVTDLNGAIVGYSTVTVKRSDGTATRFSFTNYSDYPDSFDYGGYDQHANTIYWYNNNSGSGPIRFPKKSFAFARGKVLKEELIDNIGEKVQQTDYSYSFTTPKDLIFGVKTILTSWRPNSDLRTYEFGRYSFSTQDYRLDSKIQTYFKANVVQQQTTQSFVYTDYASNLIRNITESKSGGRTDKQIFRYLFDVASTIPTASVSKNLPLSYMLYANNVADPVEVIHSSVAGASENITSASIVKYDTFPDGSIHPKIEYKLENKSPKPINQYVNYSVNNSSGTEIPVMDSEMKAVLLNESFDVHNNLLQSRGLPSQYLNSTAIFGYDGLYKIAEVSNALQNDIAFTSFECTEKGNWEYTGTPMYDVNSLTGQNCYDLSLGNLTKSGLTATQTYSLTYWTRNTSPYTISGTSGNPVTLASLNGWTNFKHVVTGVTNISIGGQGFIDEVRLCPSTSQMVTYTFEPMIGMTSKAGINNEITYSAYDEFNRLQLVKDGNKNILQAFCYNVKGEQVDCFNSYANAQKSGNFYKNDCGGGYAGSLVGYTVPSGIYRAGSQDAADGIAQRDVDENGQNYANTHGSCAVQVIYARVELSNYNSTSYSYDQDNYGDATTADVIIRLYSDQYGNTPYTLTQPLNVIVQDATNTTYGYGGSNYSEIPTTYNLPANTNSLFIGNAIISSSNNYTDPRSGIGSVTDYSQKSLDVISNGNNYIVLPTKP